jgi:hypothetical protein
MCSLTICRKSGSLKTSPLGDSIVRLASSRASRCPSRACDRDASRSAETHMRAPHLRIVVGTLFCFIVASKLFAADGNDFIEFRVIVPPRFYAPQNIWPKRPAYLVIRSAAEWIAYWSAPDRLSVALSAEVSADPAAQVPPPEVDFDRYILLVVSTGPKPTLGYTVSISSIIRQPTGGVVVSVLDVGPGGGDQCAVMAMVSHPMVFALIPKTQEPIRFLIHQVKRDCSPPRTIDAER